MLKSELFNNWLKETEGYQAGKTFEELAEEFGFDVKDILRLAGNESTIGTSPKAIKAAQEASSNSNFYAEPKSESLMNSLNKKFQEDGINMDDLAFVCGNGMDSIIEHCFNLFTKAGDSIINLSPSFIYYDFAAQRHGVNIIDIPREELKLDDGSLSFEINLEAIKARLTEAKMLFLCSPNNPDGSAIELNTIKELAKACEETGTLFFVDHAYIDFCDRKAFDAREIIQEFPSMIIGYTFSKAYAMAGFRVGYGLMHKELQEKFLTLLTPFLIAKPSIAAAQAALEDKEHLEKILKNNTEQRPLLEQSLKQLGLEIFKSEANFILVRGKNNDEVFQELLKRAIIIRQMKKLNALRITVGTEAENQRLIKALKEII